MKRNFGCVQTHWTQPLYICIVETKITRREARGLLLRCDRTTPGGLPDRLFNLKLLMMKNLNWRKVIELAIAVLTALLGVLGASAMS